MAPEREYLNKIRSLLKFHPRGLTISDLSQRLAMNRNSIAKYMEILEISGLVEMRQMGAAKVYYLSQRIPLASILGFTKEGILVVNEDGKINQVNERFCEMFTLNQAEILRSNISVLPNNLLSILNHPRLLTETDEKTEYTRILKMDLNDWSQYYKVRILSTIFDTGERGRTVIIEDITLEKEMEERLRINEARYRGIVEDQIEMICRYTPDGQLTFANEAFCSNLMIHPGEVTSHRITDFIPVESADQLLIAMKNSTPTGPVWDVEQEVYLPSGDRRWQHWVYRGIFNDAGEPIEFQGVGRDITERKKAEMELLIKSCAIESSVLPIGLATLEGILTYVNPAFLDMWKYTSLSEVIGLPLEHLAHGNGEALKSFFQIKQTIAHHASFSGEMTAVRRNGDAFNLLASVSIVKDTSGDPLCIIGYFNDITSAVRMSREMQMKDTAISHSYEGVAIICPDGRIRYTNPSFTRIFNKMSEGSHYGRKIEELYSYYPQISGRIQEIETALIQKGNWTSIVSDITEDGKPSIIQIHLSRTHDDDGNKLCTIFSALDITEQRMIEESLSLMYSHLEEAIEHVGDPTLILDSRYRIVAWNQAMTSLTGYSRGEVIGTGRYREICAVFEPGIPLLAEMITLPVRDLIQKYPRVSRFGAGLFTEAFIPTLQSGKGALIWAKASPIYNTSGKMIGVIQTMKDMTNWKRIAEHTVPREQIV
ncbi:MAG TPA: PAS domain S-box protein [Methanospirillum sp.]|nr:PAS domain S-box protein [Methanospirillum sp.]